MAEGRRKKKRLGPGPAQKKEEGRGAGLKRGGVLALEGGARAGGSLRSCDSHWADGFFFFLVCRIRHI